MKDATKEGIKKIGKRANQVANLAIRQLGYKGLNEIIKESLGERKEGEKAETVKRHPLTQEDEKEKMHLALIELISYYGKKEDMSQEEIKKKISLIKELRNKLKEEAEWKEKQFIDAYTEEEYEYKPDRENLSSLACRLKYLIEIEETSKMIEFLEEDLELFGKANRFYIEQKAKEKGLEIWESRGEIKEGTKKKTSSFFSKIKKGFDKYGKDFENKVEQVTQK